MVQFAAKPYEFERGHGGPGYGPEYAQTRGQYFSNDERFNGSMLRGSPDLPDRDEGDLSDRDYASDEAADGERA